MRAPWHYESPGCASVGGNFWFPEKDVVEGGIETFAGHSQEAQMAKAVCGSCIHKQECLQWGLKHELFGIWGGSTSKERQQMRARLRITLKEVGVANFATGVGYSPHESDTSS